LRIAISIIVLRWVKGFPGIQNGGVDYFDWAIPLLAKFIETSQGEGFGAVSERTARDFLPHLDE
jgi:hypothetical protein